MFVPMVLGLVALGAPALLATPAHADDEDHAITRYHIDAVVDETGSMDVTIDFDVNLGEDPSPGPYLTFDTHQEIENDPDHYRVLEFSDFSAESPSGASAELNVEESSRGVLIEIGDDDGEFTGVQSYQLDFQLDGVPTSGVGADGQDEIYWNAIGSGFDLPLSDVAITLDAPTGPEQTTCFVGQVGSTLNCDNHGVEGTTAQFRQAELDEGEGLSVVAAYPPETFGGVQPILAERTNFANFTGLFTAAGPAAGVAAAAGIAVMVFLGRRRGRDKQYLGLTPGLLPSSADPSAVGPAERGPIAVQFHPPEGVRPGEMGTLADEVADPHDVTATIVDLAVRGYFRIEETEFKDDDDSEEETSATAGAEDEGEQTDSGVARAAESEAEERTPGEDHTWQLVRDDEHRSFSDPDLLEYEVDVLRTLFPGSKRTVRMDALKGRFTDAFAQLQDDLYDEVVRRKWFRSSPRTVRRAWYATGVLISCAGIVLTVLLGIFLGLAVLGVPLVLIGLAVTIAGKFAPARTARGTAVLAQSLGFKQYLETAEANRIRFEESQDIFSAYLPFAIAFEVTDRWAKAFEELAAQGQQLPAPHWYSGSAVTSGYWAANMGATMSAFARGSNQVVTATAMGGSAGSYTGGSGFSGGFAGGGVGGGGGGVR
ncbi:MAG TPA: DUF2207 domain-containing protein [Beutenbergiaceae bacterium]|nr:DUF2207 domain-containing protein [Beutenbergiaceae bacterium]